MATELLPARPPPTMYVGTDLAAGQPAASSARRGHRGADPGGGPRAVHDWPLAGLPTNSAAPLVRRDIYRQLGLMPTRSVFVRIPVTIHMTELFTGLHCVAVPVRDQDRSKALFESMGFTTTMDADLQPGFRWIELAPSSGGPSLALVATGDQLPTGIDTGIRLITSDARAAHTALAAKGLEVGDILDWETAPLMFSFRDLDGNRFYVGQSS